MTAHVGRVVRLKERDRSQVAFFLDGKRCLALEGDTVLTAVLTASAWLRLSEFAGEPRAGFCLMGACQDCWMWLEGGGRVRACSTMLTQDMRLLTVAPENWP